MKTEPAWWAEARAMREGGLSWINIASRLGVSRDAVRYAVSEKRREDVKRMVMNTPYRKQKRRFNGRGLVVKKAYREAQEFGLNVDDVLRSWSEAPIRRQHGKEMRV